MRFRAVRLVNARYTVSPDFYEFHQTARGSEKSLVKGVHVHFINSIADTDEQQRRFKWSDETREVVENWLLNHEEYGINFVRDAAETETVKPSASAAWCDFILISENGTQMCGLPATEGGRCGTHQPEMATT